jgi:selenocysteine lyase/cysteine desulfurase
MHRDAHVSNRDGSWLIDDACVYLNVSGHAPRLTVVNDAGADALARGCRPWHITTEAWLAAAERVRMLAAIEFACAPECIALLPSVAQGMATAAANLPMHAGDTVVTLADEHPSGIDVWKQCAQRAGATDRAVVCGPDRDYTESVLAALDDSVRVVVLPTCHWHDGIRLDLRRVALAARRIDAALVVDATQSLGFESLDLADLDPDFVVCAGYKWLLGAPGLAYLYRAPRHEAARPLEWHGWDRLAGAHAARRVDSASVYSQPALAMAEAALGWLGHRDRTLLRTSLRQWQNELCEQFRECALPFALIADSAHITALRPLNHSIDVPALATELGRRRIHVAARGAALRVSHHLHNSQEDIHRLVSALQEIIRSP